MLWCENCADYKHADLHTADLSTAQTTDWLASHIQVYVAPNQSLRCSRHPRITLCEIYSACQFTFSMAVWHMAVESGWFSGHQPCLPPLWPGFNSGFGLYVGWVSVNLNLTPRVFLRVLRFSPLLKINCQPNYSIWLWCCVPRSYMGRA